MASSSSSTSSWTYDVFLSYTGKTRLGFTSHLYNALKQSGIHVFMDDTGVGVGEEIFDSIFQAIERSRMAFVILSPEYASSRWNLDELVKIMECRVTLGLVAIPIFYNVDPSDIRHQKGTYGEAMKRHEKRLGRESDRVLRWRQGLLDLAIVSGYCSSERLNRNHETESKLIRIIVEDVSRKLSDRLLFPANHPVGIESRVQEQTFEQFNYDVFLSYTGEDTGRDFTSHLYNALRQSQIQTVYTRIETGNWISRSLLEVIEGSRIAIIILSLAYASSARCLDEMIQIMHSCERTQTQVVFPIFYEVDPSDVHYLRGTYGEAMEQHEQRLGRESERVLRWRQALKKLSNIRGFSYSSSQYRNDGSESKLIENIVEIVSRKLGSGQLFAAEHPVVRVDGYMYNYDTAMARRPTDPSPTRALPLNGNASSDRTVVGHGCHMSTLSDPSGRVTMRLDPDALTNGSNNFSEVNYHLSSSFHTLILNNNQGTVNFNFGPSLSSSPSGGEPPERPPPERPPPARPPRSSNWMTSAISFLGACVGIIWLMLSKNNAGSSRSRSVQSDHVSRIISAIRFLWAMARWIWWMGSFFNRGFIRIAKLCFSIIKLFL